MGTVPGEDCGLAAGADTDAVDAVADTDAVDAVADTDAVAAGAG
jgi:hypothetical protein